MDKIQLGEFIKSLLPESEVKEGKQYIEVTVSPTLLHSAAMKLRDNPEALFDLLVCLSGVDYGQELGVVYHLESTKYRHLFVMKCRVSKENPVIDTVSDLWSTAEFHEREVYDLLGIKFNSHPDLRRLFLDSSWGFPLRKDYVDDINIVSK